MASLMDITGNSSSCLSTNCLVKFTVNIPSVTLASGQYYLGTTNLLTWRNYESGIGNVPKQGINTASLAGWNQAARNSGHPDGQ